MTLLPSRGRLSPSSAPPGPHNSSCPKQNPRHPWVLRQLHSNLSCPTSSPHRRLAHLIPCFPREPCIRRAQFPFEPLPGPCRATGLKGPTSILACPNCWCPFQQLSPRAGSGPTLCLHLHLPLVNPFKSGQTQRMAHSIGLGDPWRPCSCRTHVLTILPRAPASS